MVFGFGVCMGSDWFWRFSYRRNSGGEIVVREGESYEYNDLMTGEKKVYDVKEGEVVTDNRCPLDNSGLLYVGDSDVFHCPGCGIVYDDLTEEGIRKTYSGILEFGREERNKLTGEINKLREERSDIETFLRKVERAKIK